MIICLNIPFPSTEFASLVYDVLSVDKELKGSGVQRTILIEEENLIIKLQSEELKRLRVAANGLLRNIKLIVKTVEQFKNA